MISNKTSEAIKEATTITKQDSTERQMPNKNTLYTPLLKYGVIAFGIVSVIVTSAILIENKLNIRNHESVLASASVELLAKTKTEDPILQVTIDSEKLSLIKANVEDINIQPQLEKTKKNSERNKASKTLPINIASADTITPESIAKPTVAKLFHTKSKKGKTHRQNASQHQNFMLKQDQIQLQRLKLNHDRIIGSIRNQAGKQTHTFERNIQQIESSYTRQVANVKRNQAIRKSFTSNRI